MPLNDNQPSGTLPIVRWPIVCPFCQHTAPLSAYDLQEGGIYTCSGCQVVLRAASWRAEAVSLGHPRWLIDISV